MDVSSFVAAAGLALGLAASWLLIVHGLKVYVRVLALVAFVVGFAVGFSAGLVWIEGVGAAAILGVVAGLFLAFLAWPLEKAAVFILCGLGLSAAASYAASNLGIQPPLLYAVSAVGFVLGGLALFRLYDWFIVANMALLGMAMLPSEELVTLIGGIDEWESWLRRFDPRRFLEQDSAAARSLGEAAAVFGGVGLGLYLHGLRVTARRGSERACRRYAVTARGAALAAGLAGVVVLGWLLDALVPGTDSSGAPRAARELGGFLGLQPRTWPAVGLAAVFLAGWGYGRPLPGRLLAAAVGLLGVGLVSGIAPAMGAGQSIDQFVRASRLPSSGLDPRLWGAGIWVAATALWVLPARRPDREPPPTPQERVRNRQERDLRKRDRMGG